MLPEAHSTSLEIQTPLVGSPEFFNAIARQNPVYLVSADMPGSGSTTFTQGMFESLAAQHGVEPLIVHVGQAIRTMTGIYDRDTLRETIQESSHPETFDRAIYEGLPTDRSCIINGELATILGPQYIDSSRTVVCIDLVSQPLIAASKQRAARLLGGSAARAATPGARAKTTYGLSLPLPGELQA